MPEVTALPKPLPTPAELRAEPPPAVAPLAVDARALGRLLGCSLRHVRRLDSAGALPKPVKLGSHLVRWPLDGPNGIRRWLELGCPSRREFQERTLLEGNGRAT